MITNLPKPIIFAHRGASAHAPENTLSSFELAVRQNADAIELDIKLTADGEVIVIHDDWVNRTTNGVGAVANLRLDEIKNLDAGQFFDDSFRGEKIPTLNEVIEAIGCKIFINIELANYRSPTNHLPQKTAEIIKNHNIEENILFSSFNPLALMKIKKILPDVHIGLLAAPGVPGFWARSFLRRYFSPYALHPEVNDTSQILIDKCHRQNLRVHVYTVNDLEKMIQLFRWNVDGVFTDDVLLAKEARMLTTKG